MNALVNTVFLGCFSVVFFSKRYNYSYRFGRKDREKIIGMEKKGEKNERKMEKNSVGVPY